MSPGLKRARQPFFLRNLLTGVVLAFFAGGVWAYSIGAVKQEDFSDIDEEAKALRQSASQANESVREAEKKVVEAVSESGETQLSSTSTSTSPPVVDGGVVPRGVVASLLWERYPRLFDPKTKTLVWGAPSVDRVGRLGDKTSSE